MKYTKKNICMYSKQYVKWKENSVYNNFRKKINNYFETYITENNSTLSDFIWYNDFFYIYYSEIYHLSWKTKLQSSKEFQIIFDTIYVNKEKLLVFNILPINYFTSELYHTKYKINKITRYDGIILFNDDKDRIFPHGLDYYKIDDLLKYYPENKEALLVQNIYLLNRFYLEHIGNYDKIYNIYLYK